MRAAAAAAAGPGRPLVIGVTVLTSLSEEEYRATTGTSRSLEAQVSHLAREAQTAGLDGVVASPQEIGLIRLACGPEFLIVTPGIRGPEDKPAPGARDDQKRTLSAPEAIRAGASYIVVGRPIIAALDPAAAARRIIEQMKA